MGPILFDESDRAAVYRAIRLRRDIRSFRPDPVPEPVLARILAAAHRAGSVGFSQPWAFVAVRDQEARHRLRDACDRERRAAGIVMAIDEERAGRYLRLKVEGILEAPLTLAVCVDPTRGGPHVLGRNSDRDTDAYSTVGAIQNLWLAARAEGVGVGWVSIFQRADVQRILSLPPHVIPLALLCVGYPAEGEADTPLLERAGWARREPLAEQVHLERWGARAPDDPLIAALRAEEDPMPVIPEIDHGSRAAAEARLEQLTKPPASLGRLERLAVQLAGITGELDPPLAHPVVFVCAADHGVTAEGVSAFPAEVTAQMVANFAAGGAAINVLARQAGVRVVVADIGVAAPLDGLAGIVHAKVRPGTGNLAQEPAMTPEECRAAVDAGRLLVRRAAQEGLDCVCTGDMGIGNTTAASAVVAACTGAAPSSVTGRGTGIDAAVLARKVAVVERALDRHRPGPERPWELLAAVGGLEIAALAGVILEGAAQRLPVVLDGFIAGAAACAAAAIDPAVRPYLIAGHASREPGHRRALAWLELQPLLDLDLALGEGTGAVLAVPLLRAAVRVLNDMATFAGAGVSGPVGDEGRAAAASNRG